MTPEDIFTDRRRFIAFCAVAGLGATLAFTQEGAAAGATSITPRQLQTIAAIADTIIPKTETAGAIEAGVPAFIGIIVTEWMDKGQRDSFQAGLAEFMQQANARLGSDFSAIPADKREFYLQRELALAQAHQVQQKNSGYAPFLVWMKRLAVHGYYTSQAGASEELVLNVMPGEYVACHHMAADEHSFSMDRRHVPFIVDNEVVRIK